MTLDQRLDAVCDRWNVLRHPFYRRWECGELTRDDLVYYAAEYRHAVVALADLATAESTAEHGAEERAHVDLWDDFARAVDADLERAARAETADCADAWRSGGLGALYAIETTQPEIARTKLDGLHRFYGVEETGYFDVHAERDVEHAALTRSRLAELAEDEHDAVVAGAERALRGNWKLLDGVEQYAQSR